MLVNTIPIKVKDIPRYLKICHAMGMSAIFWGNTGIGKTDGVEQYARTLAEENEQVLGGAEALREHVATLTCRETLYVNHLATMEPVDVKGLNVPDLQAGVTRWLRPEFLPDPADRRQGVLFFDELNRGTPMAQNAVFDLFLKRRSGTYGLPDGYLIAAACNEIEMADGVFQMDPALCDRLVHFKVVADVESFIAYAERRGLHDSVVSFLQTHPDFLDTCEKRVREGLVLGASPRGWERVSGVLKTVRDKELRDGMICGIIGKEAAGEFFTAYEQLASFANAAELMKVADKRKLREMVPSSELGLYNLAYNLPGLVVDGDTAEQAIVIVNAFDAVAEKEPNMMVAEIKTYAVERIIAKAEKVGAIDRLVDSPAVLEYEASRPKNREAA